MNPLEMLFGGAFGPANGNMQMDPAFMENFFGPGAAGGSAWAGAAPQQAEQPQRREGAPVATSRSMMRSLPKVKVTAHDIEKNESNECSICLDELVIGQPAMRIPCGHLYHEDCIKDWLKKSNECPVCRFELPTDDAEYERGRRLRMADRKIRLRREDIAVKSAQELRRLAEFLKIDITGCLEKGEFVERIASSSQVEIVDGAAEGNASSTSSTHLFDYASAMPTEHTGAPNVRWDDVEMRLPENEAGAARSTETAPAPAVTKPPLEGQSVSTLRKLARELGVSLDGCLEKGEIVERIRGCQH
jgi:hypothetical protein